MPNVNGKITNDFVYSSIYVNYYATFYNAYRNLHISVYYIVYNVLSIAVICKLNLMNQVKNTQKLNFIFPWKSANFYRRVRAKPFPDRSEFVKLLLRPGEMYQFRELFPVKRSRFEVLESVTRLLRFL